MSEDASIVEIREPTGLQLGSFDLFQVRQRIYTGEINPRNEYRMADGPWAPLSHHPAFSEVLWLVGAEDVLPGGAKKVSRFAGWSGAGAAPQAARPGEAPLPAARPAELRPEPKTGLLGRLFGKG